MHRFYSAEESRVGSVISLTGQEAAHAVDVLRLRSGDEIVLFDGKGVESRAKIVSAARGNLSVEILERREGETESNLEITLGQGLPKADKMDYIIRKASELGVSKIVPLYTERTVPRSFNPSRLERWRKIALEACKQSGRVRLPEISEPVTMKDFVETSGRADLKLVPWEGERNLGLKEVLRTGTDVKSASVIIGPEGGLTEDEVGEAAKGGFVPVSLGRRILRTETVSAALLSILQYRYGDM